MVAQVLGFAAHLTTERAGLELGWRRIPIARRRCAARDGLDDEVAIADSVENGATSQPREPRSGVEPEGRLNVLDEGPLEKPGLAEGGDGQ